ncbi:MAG: biopolymer transporter ExbD [Candidatus Omnitrophica bacterium]|jgi:biopolymer transport protein ExbD|nr:biopolymer transporter ExbD [Candidatus Omnitrophota bacterium]MDD5078924.1 biopolymer transporter ExbD [Candidatus Omnitrophota bacterium]
MRFKRHLKLEKRLSLIEVAPLIDVVFLLLIFFMLSSNFTALSTTKLVLPGMVTGYTLGFHPAQIIIGSDGSVYLDGYRSGLEDLKAYLKEIAQRRSAVLIKAQQGAVFSEVIKIWDLCRDNGISRISIATDRE